MQKVFEKIIERLEELADNHRQAGFDVEQNGFSNVADKMYGKQCAFLQAIEIVKQTADEYNNSWIPCSERLLQANPFLLATEKVSEDCKKEYSKYFTEKGKCISCGSDIIIYISKYNGHKHFSCDKCGFSVME